MATTITVPDLATIGAFSPEVATGRVHQGLYDARVANALVDVATSAATDINALQGGTSLSSQVGVSRSVRGVVTSNVSDLTAFVVASNDGLTYSANQVVFLAAQTTGTQSGPWVVGAVASTTAPLTRPTWWAAASTQPKSVTFNVNEGTAWKHSQWVATVAGDITVDTTTPAFYPRFQKGTSVAMTGGAVNIANIWLLSTTTSKIHLTANTPGGTQGVLSAASGNRTAGAGTGEFDIASSSGTDTSTVDWTIEN
jgi:hypothetical protein